MGKCKSQQKPGSASVPKDWYNLRSLDSRECKKGPIYVDFDMDGAKVAKSGYVGLRDEVVPLRDAEYLVRELKFKMVNWDGRCV